MNMEEVVDVFIKDNQARFSRETIRSYKLSLKQFFEFCPKNFNEIATDIRAWLAFMEEKGLKKPTIHIKLSGLKSFYHYCMEENLLKKNPTKKVKTPKKEDDLCHII